MCIQFVSDMDNVRTFGLILFPSLDMSLIYWNYLITNKKN